MKKIITILAIFLMSITSIVCQNSYVGQNYDDFFSDMLKTQDNNGNVLQGLPKVNYYSDNSYNVTVVFKDYISIYTFNSNKICVQIYQFVPCEDKKTRKEIKKLMGEKFDNFYSKENNIWIERKTNGIVIEHSVKDIEIEGIKGVSVMSYMSYLRNLN